MKVDMLELIYRCQMLKLYFINIHLFIAPQHVAIDFSAS